MTCLYVVRAHAAGLPVWGTLKGFIDALEPYVTQLARAGMWVSGKPCEYRSKEEMCAQHVQDPGAGSSRELTKANEGKRTIRASLATENNTLSIGAGNRSSGL